MNDLPSGTVTFLFTDIEGSTRLLAELGAESYSMAVGEHRRLLREAIAHHSGREIDTEGDAFFVAFARASDAVAAAREAQAALAVGPIRVRMGIHSGEPLLTEEGYIGIDVHRAARIAAAGHGDQVLLSHATRELIEGPFELRDLGEHRLKDLDEPERLFQHLSEARRRLERALLRGTVDSGLRRRAVTAAAALALIQGDYEDAARYAREGVEIARGLGEPALLANAMSNLGAIVLAAGDERGAQELLEESVDLARKAGDTRVTALAMNNLGDVSLTTGDYGRAEALFQESLSSLRERGDTANVARSLFNLGAAALRLGRDGDALERLRESVTLCRALGDKEDVAWCLEGFAALAAAGGDAQRSAILLGAAQTLLRDMGAALKPFERRLHEGTIAVVADGLSEAALLAAMERGSTLTADEAIDHALGTLALD